MHDIFFDNIDHTLKPGWEAAWAAAQTAIEPLIKDGSVVGYFLGDELFPGKIPFSGFLTALGALAESKKKHPELIVWENEGGTNWVKYFASNGNGKIPAALDIISLDDYYLNVSEHRAFYEKSIYPLLSPHQSVWIVPASYATNGTRAWIKASPWCCGGDTVPACGACVSNLVEQYYAWANEDPRVSGMAPWHWDTRGKDEVSTYKEIGTVDMPQLKATWKKIAAAIAHNN